MKGKNPKQGEQMVVNEMMTPIKKTGVTVREEIEEDGKHILYNAENELILVINSTGKFILDSCTGEKTVGQIVKDIENNFTVDNNMNTTSVAKEFISTLIKAKLVTLKGGEKHRET